MKKEELIKLIDEHLQKTKYQRNNNYTTYSMEELIKVIKLYQIVVK
jgi:hypothetical protein